MTHGDACGRSPVPDRIGFVHVSCAACRASLMPSTGPTLLTRPSTGPTVLTRPSTGPTLLTRPSTGPTLLTEEPPGGPMGTTLVTGVEATRPACAWDTKPGAKPAAKVSAMSPIPVILDSLSISPFYVCLCLPGDVREGRDNELHLLEVRTPLKRPPGRETCD